MGFFKFMTVSDFDVTPDIGKLLKQCDISVYPSVYFCNDTPFIDTVNSDSREFYGKYISGEVTKMPTVPADIFEYEFSVAYKSGYYGLVIVLPHNKWTDYKHQAEIAKKRFLRKNKIDEQGFYIKFYDSKTFGCGTVSLILDFVNKSYNNRFSVDEFINYINYNKLDRYTYILTEDDNIFDSNRGLKGYVIKNNVLKKLNIAQHSDSIVFDLFAKEFTDNLKNCDYNVSFGYNCDFAMNVLGRVEIITGEDPSLMSRYGISSTHILGSSSVCFNFVRKKDKCEF